MNLKKILKKYKRKISYLISGGESYKNYWKHKKREKIETYIIDMYAPHRIWLTSFFNHANSILEVGCDWGGALVLMSETHLKVCEFYGVDISPESIEIGRRYLFEKEINNIHLTEGCAKNLSNFPDSSVDIVFCNMLLLYIDPKEIQKVIKEFLRVANDSVYLLEFHSNKLKGVSDNSEDGWVYNYTKLLQPITGSAIISIIKLPDNIHPKGRWNELATLIKIEKNKF
jgi:ubiquinone/menaquinone biosynthesis C-methylase UbiE